MPNVDGRPASAIEAPNPRYHRQPPDGDLLLEVFSRILLDPPGG